MISERVPVSYEVIAAFCQRHHIRKLALFGSVLRDDFRPDSDIDVLVEFQQNYTPGFMGITDLEMQLSEMFGQQVDLRTASELSRYFRRQVVETAEVMYAAR